MLSFGTRVVRGRRLGGVQGARAETNVPESPLNHFGRESHASRRVINESIYDEIRATSKISLHVTLKYQKCFMFFEIKKK